MRNAIIVMVAVGLMSCGPIAYADVSHGFTKEAGGVTLSEFTGAAGLDTEGFFPWGGIDCGWTGTTGMGGGTIGDVTFTGGEEPNAWEDPGFYWAWWGDVSPVSETNAFPTIEYGTSADDNTLEGIMSNRVRHIGSLRWRLGFADLPDYSFAFGRTPVLYGKNYKVQMAFQHTEIDVIRCLDVYGWDRDVPGPLVDNYHDLVVDNLEIPGSTNTGVLLAYEFTAKMGTFDDLGGPYQLVQFFFESAGTWTGNTWAGNPTGDPDGPPADPPAEADVLTPSINLITLELLNPDPGDANGDGKVDENDAAVLAANWLQSGNWSKGDFNDDGIIDGADATIMAANWGWEWDPGEWGLPGEAAVPEPSAIVMLILGALCLVGYRARK